MLNYFDYELSPEEELVRRTVREFVEQRFLPIVREHFRNGTFPLELVPELGRLGVLGCTLPESVGGAGLNAMSYGLVCQELERGDSGLRSFVSVTSSLCMFPIFRYGSDEQRRKYLPELARGRLIGCFGLTEHEHGSDPAGMETRAVKDGGHYVLNGGKMWITNGSIADLAIVWAKVPEEDNQVRGFIVERGTPGFTAHDIHDKLSLRASVTSELVFQDCRVPAEQLLPGVAGLRGPLSCLNEARFGIAFGAVGAAMACYESALEYAKVRVQFDRPIAGFQLTQKKLVDALEAITQGQLLAYQLGRLKDAGRLRPQQVNLAKRANVAMALEVAREMRSILGANGISLEHPVFRHMVNLESVYTYEGTHEVHTLAVGQDITGISAFR